MTFGVNTSPFAGREGKTGWGTSRRLRERLYNETRSNLALRVADGESPEKFVVSGRGELHLAILIETMRREGYEFEVSKPEVIYHRDPDTDEMLEPIEEVHIEVADAHDRHGGRNAGRAARADDRHAHRERHDLPEISRADARLARLPLALHDRDQRHGADSQPVSRLRADVRARSPDGSSAAWSPRSTGMSATYAMVALQQRGTFFIEPGTEVYEGMVVGEHIRPEDLAVNVCKTKQLPAIHTDYFGKEAHLKAAAEHEPRRLHRIHRRGRTARSHAAVPADAQAHPQQRGAHERAESPREDRRRNGIALHVQICERRAG